MDKTIAEPGLPRPAPTGLPASAGSLARDVRGGLATLMASICIAALIPSILNAGAALPVSSVATTAFACVLGTVLFAAATRLPFAVGPGIVPASIVATWLASGTPFATVMGMTLVAAAGFTLLVAFGLVGRFVRHMPPALKTAGEIAIGLYLLLAALRAAGVMQADLGNGVPELGTGAWLFLAGLAAVFLLARHPRLGGYATLIGVAVAAVGSALLGTGTLPERAFEWPALSFVRPDVAAALDWRHADEILVLLYVILVDVVATLETLASCEPEMRDAQGNLRGFDKALRASAGLLLLSPFLGTAPMLVFFENLGGLLSGARTARAALVAAGGFALVMLYSPLAALVPAGACAVALAYIGYNITKHAAFSLPLAAADRGQARLGRHLATAALLLVVASHYLAMALFALFVLYPLLAWLSDQKPRPVDVAAAVGAALLVASMLG